MVIYSCGKCGKTFNQKTNYLNHTIYKKIPCDVLINPLYETNKDETKINQLANKTIKNDKKITHLVNENNKIDKTNVVHNTIIVHNTIKETKEIMENKKEIKETVENKITTNDKKPVENNKILCQYCKEEITKNDNLSRHFGTCKEKKYLLLLEKYEIQKKQLEKYELQKKEFEEFKLEHKKLINILMSKNTS